MRYVLPQLLLLLYVVCPSPALTVALTAWSSSYCGPQPQLWPSTLPVRRLRRPWRLAMSVSSSTPVSPAGVSPRVLAGKSVAVLAKLGKSSDYRPAKPLFAVPAVCVVVANR